MIGGGQAGYNYQIGNIVLGLETDIQGSGADDKAACFLSCLPGSIATLDHKLAWFGITLLIFFKHVRSRLIPFNNEHSLEFSQGAVKPQLWTCGTVTAPT